MWQALRPLSSFRFRALRGLRCYSTDERSTLFVGRRSVAERVRGNDGDAIEEIDTLADAPHRFPVAGTVERTLGGRRGCGDLLDLMRDLHVDRRGRQRRK